MRFWAAFLLLIIVTFPVGSALAQSVPPYKGAVVQDETGTLSAADIARLTHELSGYGPEDYRVLVVTDAGGADMTDYLDQVYEAWKLPGNSILIVIFEQDKNIRMYMGSQWRTWNVTPQDMIDGARESFSPLARQGNLVEATLALAATLHGNVVAGGAAEPREPGPYQPPAAQTAEQPGSPTGEPAAPAPQPQPASPGAKSWGWLAWASGGAVVLALGLILFALAGRARPKSRRRHRRIAS